MNTNLFCRDGDDGVLKQVGNRKVLYVMATNAEYLDALQSRFTPLICGVGPVEAALSLTRFLAQSERPDHVMSIGSAGSATLTQGDVYQVSAVSYRDMDASAFGFEKGVTPFLQQPALVDLSPLLSSWPMGSISTGANVVSGSGYAAIGADMVDMESWALLRVCQEFDIPFHGLRGISDGAEEVSQYSDWTALLPVIDDRLAQAVDAFEREISAQ